MTRKTIKQVTIYFDGIAITVPARTWSEAETLEVLGAPMSARVALEHAKNHPLDFSRGWGFAEGQRYVPVDEQRVGLTDESDGNDWAQDPDWWKKGKSRD